MKKRSLKRLTLKKTSISNLEKTQVSGGIGSLDSQVTCYICAPIPVPGPKPVPLPITVPPSQSVVYWQCPAI